MLKNIQFLRGYAVTLVIFVHLDLLLAKLNLKPFGYAGVDLFFVISGFIMVYICKDKRPKPLDFMLKRITRIVPVYWLFTFFVFGVALVAPQLMNSTSADLSQLLKSLFFIPFEKSDGKFYPTLFVGWTLNYEMFFYAIFAIGLLLPNIRYSVFFTIFILIVLTAIARWIDFNSEVSRFYSNPLILNFGLGMVVGLLYDWFPSKINRFSKYLMCAIALLCMCLIIPTGNHGAVNAVLCTLLVATAVALERGGTAIDFKPAQWVGDASYVIYLSHAFVTQAVQKIVLPKMESLAEPVAIAAIIVTLLACFIVGFAIHLSIEKPLTRLLSPKRA